MTRILSVSGKSSTLARFSGLEGDGVIASKWLMNVLAGVLATGLLGRLVGGLFANPVAFLDSCASLVFMLTVGESKSSPVRSIAWCWSPGPGTSLPCFLFLVTSASCFDLFTLALFEGLWADSPPEANGACDGGCFVRTIGPTFRLQRLFRVRL